MFLKVFSSPYLFNGLLVRFAFIYFNFHLIKAKDFFHFWECDEHTSFANPVIIGKFSFF